MKRKHLFLILMPLMLWLLTGCRQRTPEDVMPEHVMEDVLYDYHLAQAMADADEGSDSASYRKRLYVAAVFSKHHISRQQFDHSMEWYTRHSERLFAIYQRIDKRFSESSSALGMGTSASPLSAIGDTANVWQGRQFQLLSSSGANRFCFEQRADTSFHSGDRIAWHFTTQWVYKEGMKSAVALMYVRYDNDSIATATQFVYGSGHQQVSLIVGPRPVRAVGGFIYQNAPWSQRPKLLLLSQISLIRYRSKPVPTTEADSLEAAPDHTLDTVPTRRALPDSIAAPGSQPPAPRMREIENIPLTERRRMPPRQH